MPISKLRPTYTLIEDRIEQLRAVVPEAFADGKINWETLKEVLGEYLEDEDAPQAERFGLFWPGKREARRLASLPSTGTLVPQPGEGVDEDTTRNVFIEGDNLEVLKLLRKAYVGRVKMIYIDPPYNTGNDFVYKDDYSEPSDTYLRRTGQADERGELLTTNKKAGGRFHSNWLNMMYPRLLLARELLQEDGVIFVSIDDNEVHNLREVMAEVFGEENWCGTLIWEKKKKPSFLSAQIATVTDYIVAFARDRTAASAFAAGEVEEGKMYPLHNAGNKAAVLRFSAGSVRFGIVDQSVPAQDMSTGSISTRLLDPVVIECGTNRDDFAMWGEWRYSQDTLDQLVDRGAELVVRRLPFRPNYVNREATPKKIANLLSFRTYAIPTNEDATDEQRSIFGKQVFDYPKPSGLVRFLVQAVCWDSKDALILDFFAGSCCTAHAVLDLNREDLGNRHFVVVQLPEAVDDSNPSGRNALEKGLITIAEIGKERIRRVIARMKEEGDGQLDLSNREMPEDLGFKCFRLARSHFKQWAGYQGESITALQGQFDQFETPLVDGWHSDDLLVEILLQQGFPLDSAVERQVAFSQNAVYRVESEFCEHRLWVCLDSTITQDTVLRLDLADQDIFVCLDSALNDQTKMRLSDTSNLHVI